MKDLATELLEKQIHLEDKFIRKYGTKNSDKYSIRRTMYKKYKKKNHLENDNEE